MSPRYPLVGLLLVAGPSCAEEPSGLQYSAEVRLGADDYDGFFSREGEADQAHYLRQMELGLDYDVDDWSVALEAQWERLHGDTEFEFGDARVNYTGLKSLDIGVGRIKEPFGMERQMSASALATNERSLASSALAPGKAYGFLLAHERKRFTWQAGLFQEESQSNDATRSVTTRLTWAPKLYEQIEEQNVLHLGSSLSQRWHRGDPFQIRQEGEVFSADTIIRSPRLAADKRFLAGFELAWLHQSFGVSAEHFLQKVDDKQGVNWHFNGQYVQTTWLLTGEQRRYKNGLIKGVEPSNSYGAWEVVARYSWVDARDHARGSVTDLRLLGLNAYFPHQIKFGIDLIDAAIRGDQRSPEDEGKAVSVCLQVKI